MTPSNSGTASEPRRPPVVAQEAEDACRKLTPEQTIHKKLDHEIHPFDCDDAYEEIIDTSLGRSLYLPLSIVARYTVAYQDPLPPEQEFALAQEQPRHHKPQHAIPRGKLRQS